MTTHLTTPEAIAAAQVGDLVVLEGEVIHVSDPTEFLPEPGAGRIGRVVSMFVETDEQPGSAPQVDSAGNEVDDATFDGLLVEPGSSEHVAGSGGPNLATVPQPAPDPAP